MDPKTYQLEVDAFGIARSGSGVLAAYVPLTADGPAVIAIACDPRHDPGKSVQDIAAPVIGFIRRDLGDLLESGDKGRPVFAVIDGHGRFNEAVPVWPTNLDEEPLVAFQRFPTGISVEAFFKEGGASAEAAIEILSAILESPSDSADTPSQIDFLGAVEAHGNLPAPGSIFRKVDAAAQEGDAKKIAEAVQPDPMISASLINSANAARFASAGKTASVPQAVVRLGTSFVRRVVFVSEMMGRYQKGACPAFDYSGYWMNAIATGAAMRGLMEDFDIPVRYADDAFTIGLLSGIGWLAIAETFPALMTKYLESCQTDDPITKARAQQEVFPCSLRMVSERYLERFDFPPHIAGAVAGKTDDDRDWYDCLARATRVAQGLSPFDCVAVPHTIPVPEKCREEWERWRSMLGATR
jgi:HD-like signal output (HDOD) protein